MSIPSDAVHVWNNSTGGDLTGYGSLWADHQPPAYPDLLAGFPHPDLVWGGGALGGGRCRGGAGGASGGKKPRRRVASVAQRRAANIRERRRMFNLNEAFDKLRRKVPTFAYEKRLSRIETLRLAITYIGFMCELLHGAPPPRDPRGPAMSSRHFLDPELSCDEFKMNEYNGRGLSSALNSSLLRLTQLPLKLDWGQRWWLIINDRSYCCFKLSNYATLVMLSGVKMFVINFTLSRVEFNRCC
ncbi:uncharacterized protein LOC143921323 [Arctopsyche grandis]|uniref:uncharacterized protein LOC143921323 n=1 Tax=Arctopsyche grandis TaxID=121162 RepID=UPI00406DA12D